MSSGVYTAIGIDTLFGQPVIITLDGSIDCDEGRLITLMHGLLLNITDKWLIAASVDLPSLKSYIDAGEDEDVIKALRGRERKAWQLIVEETNDDLYNSADLFIPIDRVVLIEKVYI